MYLVSRFSPNSSSVGPREATAMDKNAKVLCEEIGGVTAFVVEDADKSNRARHCTSASVFLALTRRMLSRCPAFRTRKARITSALVLILVVVGIVAGVVAAAIVKLLGVADTELSFRAVAIRGGCTSSPTRPRIPFDITLATDRSGSTGVQIVVKTACLIVDISPAPIACVEFDGGRPEFELNEPSSQMSILDMHISRNSDEN
eukprot:Opistho-2@22327